MSTRRNLLAMMGAAPVSLALANTEAVAETMAMGGDAEVGPAMARRSLEMQLRMADAMEGLAREIRAGTIAVTHMNTNSEINVDHWLKHHVSFDIEVLGPKTS